MIAYTCRVPNTTQVLDHQFDLKVKGQGHINLKFVLWLKNKLFDVLTRDDHIWHNDCIVYVD